MNAEQRLEAIRAILDEDGAMVRLTDRHGENGVMFTMNADSLGWRIEQMARQLGVSPDILLCLAIYHMANLDLYSFSR